MHAKRHPVLQQPRGTKRHSPLLFAAPAAPQHCWAARRGAACEAACSGRASEHAPGAWLLLLLLLLGEQKSGRRGPFPALCTSSPCRKP